MTPVLPEAVSIVLAELAGDVQEGACSRWLSGLGWR
jgi:hypothetical protein